MQKPAIAKARLYNPELLVPNSEIWLTGERANYVARVLRLKIDHKLVIFDGNGGQFPATIRRLARDRVLLQVGDREVPDTESPLAVHLIQGISRGGRMDVVIQKATELGVRKITPVITTFSIIKLDRERAEKRREHWLKIAQSACEQCGRNTLPGIDMAQKLDSWLAHSVGNGASRIMLDPRGGDSISALLPPDGFVELLVGPEGGLSAAEYAQCAQAGFKAVSLGPRILRTETAALAGMAVLQAVWGDLN